MTIKCGIDYSMNSPSLCIWDDSLPLAYENVKFYGLSDTKKYQGIFGNVDIRPYPTYEHEMERYDTISEWAMKIMRFHGVEKVSIEGYSMGSKGMVFNLAENCGLLKFKMWRDGIEYIMPAPTQIKKLFTGRGNASKGDMVSYFNLNTKVDMIKLLDGKNANSGPVNDLCDSYAMLYALK